MSSTGRKNRLADTLGLLTAINLELGDGVGARRRLGEGLAEWKEVGDVSSWGRALQLAARLALTESRLVEGARLLGALQALRDLGEPFLTPAETLGMANPEQPIRDSLTTDEFAAAFEEGRRWPVEEALAHAAD